jgi:uncharacterized protein (TIGR03435 family)
MGENMTIGARAIVIFLVTAWRAMPQSFDVASIKPNPDSSDRGMHRTPGRLTATASVRALISIASNIPEIQIIGGPDWVNSQRYDIIATTPASPDQTFVSQEDKQRIRGLLVERFKLITHIEKRERPIYVLVIAKEGIRLSPPTLTDSRPGLTAGTNRNEGHLSGVNVALSMLADFLTQELGRSVQDQTDLKGRYDFKMKCSRSDDISTPSESPSVFVALREQLGLNLIPRKGRIDFIVVDHVERPSEN